MDDLIAEIKRVLEEDDPTITVQEFIPQLNDEDSTPDAHPEPPSLAAAELEAQILLHGAGILHSESTSNSASPDPAIRKLGLSW
jgi:hypothetical protein